MLCPMAYKETLFLGDDAYMWSHVGLMIFSICLDPTCGDVSRVFIIMDQVSLHITWSFPYLDF